MTTICLLITVAALGLVSVAQASEPDPPPYPVDVTKQTLADSSELARLHAPGNVFITEGFETPDALDRFFNLREYDRGAQTITTDPALAHSGSGALQLDTIDEDGRASDASVSLWFGPGHDTVYFRTWIKFSEDYDQGRGNHVNGTLWGWSGDDREGGMGNAGQRPDGTDRFSSGFEPWKDRGKYDPPGAMGLYTYWMDMKQSGDGKYWGNHFSPPEEDRVTLERGVWHCLEHMIASNTVGKADGEIAAWVDGKLYMHLKGFRWRSTEELRVKRVSLLMYIHRSHQDNTVWYDDVALSTGYIGP